MARQVRMTSGGLVADGTAAPQSTCAKSLGEAEPGCEMEQGFRGARAVVMAWTVSQTAGLQRVCWGAARRACQSAAVAWSGCTAWLWARAASM